MGLFSRMKGRRGEQQLVLFLKSKGWNAERILRQYLAPGDPDIWAEKGELELTFELKTYKNAFKSIYDFYYSTKGLQDVVGLALHPKGPCAAVSTNFEALLSAKDIIFDHPSEKQKRIYKRFETLNQKRGKADFLVLKDNNKDRLFIKYWV